MKTLIVISSKSPNPHLYNCISALKTIQIKGDENYKICVVDSDSDHLTYYNKVKEDFPDVELCFVKNKHYEHGAWSYALGVYPDYDNYICIQDSLIINRDIDMTKLNDNIAYTFFHHSGYHSHHWIKGLGIDLMKGSDLNYHGLIDTHFNLATHCSFIVNNATLKDIFKSLPNPPTNKDGSCVYERNFGLYFILKGINTINLEDYMQKIHGGRR